ncbi:Acetyltransferase (GNAT) family protein [Calidithermus terrae]|uniref:Acetyltransferase (GNAT) family protein n=1 Tax=Calidithermus terrae TaxID=1408545 RepID=A0A399EIH7_9DEIN|nr:GNAT family N-acetyltransferase [Calidithermus terrae]RIH83233.1 Acetyltransferase (GNAT) family protein [Calidithermus terrae]
MLKVQVLSGSEAEGFIPELARLRIEVFREFPYLYAGSLEYERRYLEKFLRLPESALVVVQDAGRVVGASTALPLAQAEAEFQEPFQKAGLEPAAWYYFGESVLERDYRGRGLGAEFFKQREARARALGYANTTFCAVVRPENHPLRPPDYRPLDAFWERQGYRKRPDLLAHFSWQDLDEAQDSPKPMVFWVKGLEGDER